MKVKCSACGAIHSLDALVANEAASQALNAALLINGELGRALIGYLGLFRPTESSLTFKRVITLLNELTPMITAQTIKRDRDTFPAPPEAWIYAINQMLANRQTLKLPLKSHGYLLEIIASYKPVSTAVVVSDYGKSHTHSTSSKMNAVKGALEWATNG
ncbi:hypothetical protein [Glaesserella parasuis]|uniref:hypothetical protein n=1 Tax=Glaesserella parasuis TaxID=738 RepID=UPI0024369ED7|nr:hypothetical protein [Glaesserella parasuis]MDG6235437.1 hypothetical protein [Glaesserella parasuis]